MRCEWNKFYLFIYCSTLKHTKRHHKGSCGVYVGTHFHCDYQTYIVVRLSQAGIATRICARLCAIRCKCAILLDARCKLKGREAASSGVSAVKMDLEWFRIRNIVENIVAV